MIWQKKLSLATVSALQYRTRPARGLNCKMQKRVYNKEKEGAWKKDVTVSYHGDNHCIGAGAITMFRRLWAKPRIPNSTSGSDACCRGVRRYIGVFYDERGR